MPVDSETLSALAAVVEREPANVALGRLLAELYLDQGLAADAERAFKEAIRHAPAREDLKLGLARALQAQGNNDAALAILESHLHTGEPSPAARLQLARLLLAAGHAERAAAQYLRAVEEDPRVADAFLAKRLKIEGEASRPTVVDGRVRVTAEGVAPTESPDAVEGERPRISFRDVGGMDALKDEIRLKIIHPLTHPELYRAYGKPIGGGILLYGPPGCGKTYLARATAGEVNARFLSVGINDVLTMWLGESEKNLHKLFEDARRQKPCVLFFDEVDALGASRSDMRANAGRHLINQFLSELDGIQGANDGVLILAATNAPWHVDPAFRRPGRFDRVLFVPPPDVAARARVLEILCRGKPSADLDFERLAKRSEQFSGADLKALVDLAIERKLEEAIRVGRPSPLTTKDLEAAAKSVRPSTKEWFGTARNYVLYANQSGLYDDVRSYLDER
ncbi:MAG: AAA family ATPase [bacterium]